MPSTTAIAISPERQFLRRMVTGLTAAGGEVTGVECFKDAYKHLAEARAVFYHATTYPDDNIQKLSNVLKGRKMVLLLPRPGIVDLIEPLALDQVSAVLAVAAADAATLAGVASRTFFGNIFGIERYVPFGVRVHSTLIRDYHQKSVAMATLANFAKHMAIRRKYLENIERVADELLMNALYDAPLVASQLGMVNGGPPSNDQLVLQFASDGEMFALAVTDYYGALQRETFIEYVSRCLVSARPTNQPEAGSGAGLGLYLVASSVSQLLFNVSPGVATEVVALFDLKAPKIRLTHLSFETERAEAARVPSLAAGRPRPAMAGAANGARRRGTPLYLKVTLAATVLVLLAAASVLLWDQLSPSPQHGALTVTTEPAGATVLVDGQDRGRTPESGDGLNIPDLRVGRHTVHGRLEAHSPSDPVVATVVAGQRSKVLIRLEPLRSSVKLLSIPAGASVLVDGELRGKTPTTLEGLTPGSRLAITLTLEGYQNEERVLTAPRPGSTDAELFQLSLAPDWGQIHVTANVQVKGVRLNGRPVGTALPLKGFRVPVGEHTLELTSRWPYLRHSVSFKIPTAGHEERIDLRFGIVRPVGEDTRVFWDGAFRRYDIYLQVGQYALRVKDAKTGAAVRRDVLIRPGQAVFVKP